MKQTSVDFIVKELSEILGKLVTTPMQDLLIKDAIEKARAMHREEVVEAYKAEMEVDDVLAVVYYNNTFNEK